MAALSRIVRNWIVSSIERGDFQTRRDLHRHALQATVFTVLVADIMNVISHLLLDSAGLLPYDVWRAILVGTAMTTLLAGVLTYSIHLVVGMHVRELTISRREFERLSRTDMLSGLSNRRHFVQTFAATAQPFSIVLFDIDRFKSINDRYGHEAGDRVITAIAGQLALTFPAPDLAARIGGEEFAVLVLPRPGTTPAGLVEAVRQAIDGRPIAVPGGELHVTISAGLAQSNGAMSFEDVFSAADKALYAAKIAGRNRVVHADDIPALMLQPPAASQASARKA